MSEPSVRVDSHQHFWTYDPSEYGWITETMGAIARDFQPKDLAPLLERAGLAGSVAVQARQSLRETDALLAAADTSTKVLGVVGWVDLRDDDETRLRETLERYAAHPRFVGVRHVVQDEPDVRFLLRDDFLRGVALLADFDLTYDILIYPHQLPAAIEFVRRFPEHRLVLDHIAKPIIRDAVLEPWAESIRELARAERLFCKVSGMVTEASWTGWQPSDFTPYLDVVFEAFGPERLLFGSDWPVCTIAAEYEDVLDLVSRYIADLSESEQEAIMGDNAVRFYGLTP